MTTLVTVRENTPVTCMVEDLYTPGYILFSEDSSLRTTKDESSQLIAGKSGEDDYREGVGGYARFQYINSILQLNRTQVLVVDQGNHCVRLVDRLTNQTSPLIGSCTHEGSRDGDNALSTPSTIIFDSISTDQLLLLDLGNNALKAIKKASWFVTTLFKFASPDTPRFIVQQENGNLYMTGDYGVFEFDYFTQVITTIAGSSSQRGFLDGSLLESLFEWPLGMIFLSPHKLLMADRDNHRLRYLDLKLDIVVSICTGEENSRNGNLRSCEILNPRTLLVFNNTIYIGTVGRIQAFQGEISYTKQTKIFIRM